MQNEINSEAGFESRAPAGLLPAPDDRQIIAFDLGSDNPGADFTIASMSSDGSWHISLSDEIRKIADLMKAEPNPFSNSAATLQKMKASLNARINEQPGKARRAHQHRKREELVQSRWLAFNLDNGEMGKLKIFQPRSIRIRRKYFLGKQRIA